MSDWFDPATRSSQFVFQAVTLPLVALLFARSVYRSVRRGRSRVGAVAGVVIWFAAGVAILLPDVTNRIAGLLGIGRGADLLLYLLAIAFFVSAFYFYQKCHRLESDLTLVVRRLALREGAERAGRIEDPAAAPDRREPQG